MSSPKAFTANDIERYHRGEMTAAEMHDLEKATLDDPMLADALEGYVHTPAAAADVQALQNRLQQRLQEKKGRNIFFMGPRWMKIVALFVLLAGSGWLVFQTFYDSAANMADANDETVEMLSREMAGDSVSIVQSPPPPPFTDTLQRYDEVVASGTKRSKETAGIPQAPFSAPSDVAQENRPQTNATQAEESNKEGTSEIDALSRNAPVNTNREAEDTGRHVATLQEKAEQMNEAAPNRQMQSARAKAATGDEAEPEGGWEAFERYIVQSRKPLDEKKKAVTDGAVELQFDIDQNGKPVNIRVTKSLCEKCDAEAIRLLQEGPKWKGKKGKVKIRSPLSP